ncbi:hypothetical protein LXL04_007780 [Taraxacum kok-saghyz]
MLINSKNLVLINSDIGGNADVLRHVGGMSKVYSWEKGRIWLDGGGLTRDDGPVVSEVNGDTPTKSDNFEKPPYVIKYGENKYEENNVVLNRENMKLSSKCLHMVMTNRQKKGYSSIRPNYNTQHLRVAVKAIAILHRQPPVPVILTQRRAADLLNVGRKIVRGSSADGIDLSKSYFISSASKICRSSSTSVAGDETRDEEVFPITPLEVNQVKDTCSKWEWRGYTINYLKYEAQNDQKSNPPLLLVHGFGASVAHWRRNIPTLGQTNTVYAIDLLGFGASDKPPGFEYTMEAWAQLILDFVDEIVQRPTVLIGNSVGSLACVIAAADGGQSLVEGLVLLNCAGGMNNKAIVDDWRIKLIFPLLLLIDFLLKQKGIASFFFERVRQRESLRNILLSIYGNKDSVDEDLVQIIREPALAEGALDAFVSIVTGPPGPSPVQLMPKIKVPVLILWGNEDPFTPLDGPVGKYFSSLPSQVQNISLYVLEGVGHCPHDDRPNLVHEKLLPWLATLPSS